MGLCSEVADSGENLQDHPRPREQIRPPQGPVSACKWPGKFAAGALNLFLPVQTKPCLGHCITRGIGLRRQATILRLRGAVLFSGGETGAGGEFGRARGVERIQRQDFCRADARQICQQMEYGTLWFRSRYRGGAWEISMNHKGVEYTLTRSETPGFWKWQFRIGDLVRSGKTEASLVLLAMRRVELRIDRELKHATRQFIPGPSPRAFAGV
jgi:hypothetical protein